MSRCATPQACSRSVQKTVSLAPGDSSMPSTEPVTSPVVLTTGGCAPVNRFRIVLLPLPDLPSSSMQGMLPVRGRASRSSMNRSASVAFG